MLNGSGQISLGGSTAGQSVNLELGLGASASISLNDASVRKLTGTASGTQISLPTNFWGKSNQMLATISSNLADLNLRTYLIAAGWDQQSEVIFTVASGVYIYSTNTANAALTINGSWPGGLTIVNNGYIIGKGADGTKGGINPGTGTAGGNAISNSSMSVIITNNGYIAGGGGGGAGSGATGISAGGGGGAGGGKGADNANNYGLTGGGAGGSPGSAGGNGTYVSNVVNGFTTYYIGSGGGGGRILPGVGGAGATWPGSTKTNYTAPGGGAGGGGGTNWSFINPIPPEPAQGIAVGGGGGGGWGASGGAGGNYSTTYTQAPVSSGGAGGSGGNAGGNWSQPLRLTYTGGAGGKAIALNGYAVNYTNNGTIYGAVS